MIALLIIAESNSFEFKTSDSVLMFACKISLVVMALNWYWIAITFTEAISYLQLGETKVKKKIVYRRNPSKGAWSII